VRCLDEQSLAELAVSSVGVGNIEELHVELATRSAPSGWFGPARLSGIVSFSVDDRGSRAEVRLKVGGPIDPALLLSAAYRVLVPMDQAGDRELISVAPNVPMQARSFAGHFRATAGSGHPNDKHLRTTDLIVTGPDSPTVADTHFRVVEVANLWVVGGIAHQVDVDPRVHRPMGRSSINTATSVRAESVGSRWVFGSVSCQGELRAADVSALTSVTAVYAPENFPSVLGHQLTACGIDVLPSSEAGQHPVTSVDRDQWAVHRSETAQQDRLLSVHAASVRASRQALRAWTPQAALADWPSVSAVLLTHRTQYLSSVLSQVARWQYPRLELVVALHGPQQLDDGISAQLAELPFPHKLVRIDGDVVFGAAMGMACDMADGALITKVDDDDIYGPAHIWDLVLARTVSGAQIVGKTLDWIRVESADVTVWRPEYRANEYCDFVAGGTMCLSAEDLRAVGGWRPVPKSIDRALLDRMLGAGGLVYRTHGLGYAYVRRGMGHTAQVSDAHFLKRTIATWPGVLAHAEFGTGDD